MAPPIFDDWLRVLHEPLPRGDPRPFRCGQNIRSVNSVSVALPRQARDINSLVDQRRRNCGPSPFRAARSEFVLLPGYQAILNWSAHFAPHRLTAAQGVFVPAFELVTDGGGGLMVEIPALAKVKGVGFPGRHPAWSLSRLPFLRWRYKMHLAQTLFGFQRPIRRTTYWLAHIGVGFVFGFLTFVVILVGAAVATAGSGSGSNSTAAGVAGATVLVLWLIPFATVGFWIGLALAIKRCHDRDYPGAIVLLMFIPFFGGLWAFIDLGFIDGTSGPNRFGPSPKGIVGAAVLAQLSVVREGTAGSGGGAFSS